ncbi:MarR family transcriptional regulator [Ureibacillus sp. 179-F W5.1 NHS]|uniref:MarR family transcriptional regulator n=1 Tax=Lysinibacillus halotolerans TaxID=1368476 RepID=A0A3M8HG88_9BACI|nr:MarR family transcriptional regulator [Lysinibacillus halotolerans]RND01389.1 MarR family transcriptional regulator [Lysinibacillus halotolerans]
MDQSCEDVKNMMFMFKNIDRQVTQNFEKCTGISLTRYEILYTLLNSGQLSQIELQKKLKIDQAAITRHLKILEEKNLVYRNRNKQNNREVIVEITNNGMAILENCDSNKTQFFDELFHDFTTKEKQQLQMMLKKLMVNSGKQTG